MEAIAPKPVSACGDSGWTAAARSSRRMLLACLYLLVTIDRTEAQVYKIEFGSSTLFNATGGAFEVVTPSSSILISAGQLRGRGVLSARFQHKFRDLTAILGDDFVDFDLPSDVFGGRHNIPLRGARLDRNRKDSRMIGFIGTTATVTGTPFFIGRKWDQPLGMLFATRSVTPQLRIFSKNVFSTRPTSIQAVEWSLRPSLIFAAAGGVGNGKRYGAVSSKFNYKVVSGKVAYASHSLGFRRLALDSRTTSEVKGGNVSIMVRPSSFWTLNVARQNLIQERTADQDSGLVTINQLGGGLNAAGFRLVAAIFASHATRGKSGGTSLMVGHKVTGRLDLALEYFRYAHNQEKPSSRSALTVRTRVNSRISLLQLVTKSKDQTSINLGGEFLSNLLDVVLGYQTTYLPLGTENPFLQVMGVDMRIHGPGGMEVRIGTQTTPKGHLKYTISTSSILSSARPERASRFRFPKYMIRGLVVDEQSQPITGAVLRIGKEIVITNEEGRFSFRTNNASRLKLAVLTEEFLLSGRFEVVSAPADILPGHDDAVPAVTIIARRH